MTTDRPIVICTTTGFYPEVEKIKPIAAYLASKGFEVHFLTGADFRAPIEAIGVTFHSFHGPPAHPTVDQPEKKTAPPQAHFKIDLEHTFIPHTPFQYVALQNLAIEITQKSSYRGQPLVIIAGVVCWGYNPLKLDAPWTGPRPPVIVIGHAPLFMKSIDAPPFNSGLIYEDSDEARARNVAANEYFENVLLKDINVQYNAMLESVGAKRQESMLDSVFDLSDLFLQLSVPSLEWPRSDAPNHLRYIGWVPVTSDKSSLVENDKLKKLWNEITESKKPIVAVTQGTIANSNYVDLILPTMKALTDVDVLVLVVLGQRDATFPSDLYVPNNVRIIDYVPFDLLFPHVAIVVSNGGFGTRQQALVNGVPLVLCGLTEDKMEANVLAAWSGAAIDLKCQTAEVEDVKSAVKTILYDRKYKTRALALKEEFSKCNALEEVEKAIQDLVN